MGGPLGLSVSTFAVPFVQCPVGQFLQFAVPRLSAFQLHCEGGYFGDVEARVPQGATFVEVLCELLLIQQRFLHQ